MKENSSHIMKLATMMRDAADELDRISEMSVDDIFRVYAHQYSDTQSEQTIRDIVDRFVLSYGRFTLSIIENTFSWGFEYLESSGLSEVLDTIELVGCRDKANADLAIRMDKKVWQSIYPTNIDVNYFERTSTVSETEVESYAYAEELMKKFILSNRSNVVDDEINATPRPEWNLFRDHVRVVCRNLKRKEG